jgi:hypothetical protein
MPEHFEKAEGLFVVLFLLPSGFGDDGRWKMGGMGARCAGDRKGKRNHLGAAPPGGLFGEGKVRLHISESSPVEVLRPSDGVGSA